MFLSKKNKIVTVGGGTGTYTILKGLKKYTDYLDITAVVTMADAGGSTGRLRDEFGQLPMGDARMALVAMSPDNDSNNNLLRQLFLYRFNKGEGLSGHNFGNLFLTALTDILGDTGEAIEAAGRILRISGQVLPVTLNDVHLKATYNDGTSLLGEHLIDDPERSFNKKRIINLTLSPKATLNPLVSDALISADMIILGPGDLYTSILANCAVNGFAEAMRLSHAKLVFVSNLMSRLGQTIDMHLSDYVSEIKKYTGKNLDHILFNSTVYPKDLLNKYHEEGNHQVLNNITDNNCLVHEKDLISTEAFKKISGDIVKRSLIRHDSDKLAKVIIDLLNI